MEKIRNAETLKGRCRYRRIAVAVKLMRSVLADVGFADRPLGVDAHMMIEGGAAGEIRRGHGLEGDAQALLQRIDFERNVGFFLKGPAELIGRQNDVNNAFVVLKGPIEGDVGHGELTDFRFAARFVVDVET